MAKGRELPARPNLEHLKKQAKRELKRLRAGNPQASLAEAQFALARQYGFSSWAKLKAHVEETPRAADQAAADDSAPNSQSVAGPTTDEIDAFLRAAMPLTTDHRAGDLDEALRLLRSNPSIAAANIYTAAALGAHARIAAHLETDPNLARQPGGPFRAQPLCYLCFSRFLRLRRLRSGDFVKCARVLLDAGADPNSHYVSESDGVKEHVLYGASALAADPALTRVLLKRGADPNDGESLYHAAELLDHSTLKLLLRARPNLEHMSYCMCHKMDMEDPAGLRLFIKAGADVNIVLKGGVVKGFRPLHFAILRRRSARIIKMLLDAGADPNLPADDGSTAYSLARRLGQTKIAQLLLKRGAKDSLDPVASLLAALSAGDRKMVAKMLRGDPSLKDRISPADHPLLVDAAEAGNEPAVELMLDVGFPIETIGGSLSGWQSTALQRAACHGHTRLVRLLLKRGADPATKNNFGGDALGAAIHGMKHAHHRNGAEIAALIASKMKRDAILHHLDLAKSNGDRDIESILAPLVP